MRRGRSRRRTARQSARGVAASQGAQGRRAGRRRACRHPPHLSHQSRRSSRTPRRPGPVLEQRPRGLQGRRRTTRRGGLMSTPPPAPSIRHEIVVEAPIERAFSVFTDGFGSFKPPEHNMLAVEIAATVFEPRVGGDVYDRGVDGSVCRWARVLAYEPPDRVVISWDISPQWQIESDPEKTSEVDVRFVAEAPDRTRVDRKSTR